MCPRARLGEGSNEVCQGGEGDAASRLYRLDREGDGKMALARAGWAQEVHDLVPKHVRSKALITPPPAPKRRGRPPRKAQSDHELG